MKSFKQYVLESMTVIKPVIDTIISDIYDKFTVDEKSKTVYYRTLSKNRESDKEILIKRLENDDISFTDVISSKGSIPVIKIVGDDKNYVISFKPIAGGMGESTINSTITELIPSIMFMKNLKPSLSNDKLIETILSYDFTKLSVFVNNGDAKSGRDFIEIAQSSTKFEEKMNNARAISKYLTSLDSTQSIKNVFWSYRAKPKGVDKNSPADIVVDFGGDNLLGISLKAGGKSTKEPQLNTYINPVLKFFNDKHSGLDKVLWDNVYKHVPNISKSDFKKKSKSFKTELRLFEKDNLSEYNTLYDLSLELIRDYISNVFEQLDEMIEYIKSKILLERGIPVKVIKAIGLEWKELVDKNILSTNLPMVDNIKVVSSNTSKQQFSVILQIDNAEDMELMFSVRTNRPKGSNKLLQVPNLAVKYNGLK